MTTESDYWCNRSLVITVEGPDSRQRVEVDKPFARLGSHDLSEVLIPDKGVSRRRLYFHATDDGVFCVDLAQVKSATSRSRGWLAPDDCIRLGPYRIWAQLAPPAASEVLPPPQTMADLEAKGTAAEPQPVMVMSIKGKEIARRDLTRQLTVIGRRSPSTLRITSHSVSATHCVLYWKSGILWVVDLFSGNGTRLHGRPIDVARFSPGDSLKVGRAELLHLDMFEDLPDYEGHEPAEISYSASHDASVQENDLDNGQGSEIDIDDSSPEIAESLALAARLATQRDELDAEVAAWNDRRRVADAELAERTEHLTAAQAELDGRKAQWEETRQREEAELAARKSQLAETATALENEKEQLDVLRKQAEEERRQREDELADRAGRLDSIKELQAELDGHKAKWKETRQREEAELADRKSQLDEMATALEKEQNELATRHEQAEEESRTTEAALADQARGRESIERLEAEIEDRRREFEREKDAWSTEQNRREAEYQRRVEELLKRQEEFLTQQEDAESRQSQRREEAIQSERELAQGREDLERQRSELAAARDELRQQGEAWQSKHQDQERSLDERQRQLQEASALLAADRDEFDGLREKREEENRQMNERLEELAQQLAGQRAELQSRGQAWETKRQQDENAINARSEELDVAFAALAGDREQFEAQRNASEEERRRQDDERAGLSEELSDKRADLERDRQAWAKKRQQDETAVADRSTKLDQASAALTGDREQFEAQRNEWEEERCRIDAEQTDRSRQLAREQAEFLQQREEWALQRRREDEKSRQRPAAADDPGVTRRLEELRQERKESRPDQQSAETGPPESSAISNPDGSPRLAALTTIRRGPRWVPANHADKRWTIVAAYWARVMLVAVACSGIAGAAVWVYLTPAQTSSAEPDEFKEELSGTDSPSQETIDGEAIDGSPRLLMTVAGMVLGLLIPILLAAAWSRRRSAAGSRLPYGLA